MIPEAVTRKVTGRVVVVVVLSRRLVRRILLAVDRTVPMVVVLLCRCVRDGRRGGVRGFALLDRRRIDGVRRGRRAGRRGRHDLIPVIGSRPVASLP